MKNLIKMAILILVMTFSLTSCKKEIITPNNEKVLTFELIGNSNFTSFKINDDVYNNVPTYPVYNRKKGDVIKTQLKGNLSDTIIFIIRINDEIKLKTKNTDFINVNYVID